MKKLKKIKCPFIISRNINRLDIPRFMFYHTSLLKGVDPIQSQSCLNINFATVYTFSFYNLNMIPDGLGKQKIKKFFKNNAFNCYIVSIGKKYIQVENKH